VGDSAVVEEAKLEEGAIGEVGYEAVVCSGLRSRMAGSGDMMVSRAIEE
jgi:hypothetical protein